MVTDAIKRAARFDSSRRYRYRLDRCWRSDNFESNNFEIDKSDLVFVMLNPSCANETADDPTLRACIQVAQRWGFGSLSVVNLFGYCTAHPAELKTVADPVGPENDDYLIAAAEQAQQVVLAWGNAGVFLGRDRTILTLLTPYHSKLSYLQINRSGQPRHPLYIPRNAPLKPYTSALNSQCPISPQLLDNEEVAALPTS